MKLAAVDIGSNAIRLQITNVIQYEGKYNFKKLEYLRFPLRLGKDVFNHKQISELNKRKFTELMRAFKILIDLYEVDDCMVCATSAMRESSNGKEIAEWVKNEIGLKIHIIDGNREAELINKALYSYIDNRTYLHIDVGGGSTELNIYKRSQKTASRSFKIGSVRSIDEKITASLWRKMKSFIIDNLSQEHHVICIGTGGNINKVFELSNPRKNKRFLELTKIKEIQEYLESFSYDERIHRLNLNEDRADVIIPATKIYTAAMEAANSKKMIVPDVGLKDGVMNFLFERNLNREKIK
ncbi:Ppx/GppA phosphatase family protein [Negadavirga shengliensis]|uniref:Ppx/GppA phosphatase family protein n=1 Tax=Negadavirga shengliensis TaxID=1389218 RepID=A0ABV9T2K2_9BACT